MTSAATLTILDVGHGNSAVLTSQSGTIIIDAGPRAALLEYLTEQNIFTIDTLLLSHADSDHIAGLLTLLTAGMFDIRRVRLNSDALKGSDIWDDLVYELHKLTKTKSLDFRPSLTTSDTGSFDQDGVRIEIVAPNTYLASRGPGSTDRNGRRLDSNSISAVIRVLIEDLPVVLLAGDIDDVGLDNLIEEAGDLTADTLVFPHHGGRAGHSTDMEAFTAKLCNVVKPRQVIFSVKRSKQFPIPDVIRTVKKHIPHVRLACTQLSEHCANALISTLPKHLANVFAAGREKKRCCAGSLIIELNSPNSILPEYTEHQAFITIAAPTALCRDIVSSS